MNNDTFYGVFYVPSYTMLNGLIAYKQENYRIAMNVNNITNQKYSIG